MERKLKNFWVLPLTLMLATPHALAHNNDMWEGLVKKLFGKSKHLKLTAGRETSPSVKFTPKVINFKGVLEVPSYVHLSSGQGQVNAISGQIIFDNQIVCNYSPRSNNSFQNKVYYLQNCSDGSRSNDDISVNNKVELKLNYASSSKASLQASLKVIRADEVSYGLVFPYIEATEGQILMFNGEAWVAADVSELNIPGGNGEAGEQGPMGPQGPQGPVGPVGATGAQGEKGDKGDKGDPGVAGPQGPAGVAGAQGAQGLTGPVGPAGPVGAAGVAGPQGPAGATGAQGLTGPVGPVGPKGDTGATGAVGPQGPAGAQGPQGLTGPVGPQGPAGQDGAQGAAGAIGPQGPKGDQGVAGAQGPKGDTGATGSQGPQGPMGPMGLPGAQGLQGLPGEAGPQGPEGAAGAKGDKGDKGDRGLSEIAYLRDEKPNNTVGGTCVASAGWYTRTLNTMGGDTTFISLSNNRFTLQPGTYFIEAHVPGFAVAHHQAKLKVIETNTDVLLGAGAMSAPAAAAQTHSIIIGEIIVSVASTFEIQHRCGMDKAGYGFGYPMNFGTTEIYTQVKVIKKQ